VTVAPVAQPSRSLNRSRRRLLLAAGLSFVAATLLTPAPAALLGDDPDPARPADSPMISHSVFFTLNEPSDAGRAELVAACQKYLTGHEGATYFSAGARAEGFDRDVNDKTFDVALIVVFESKEAHDKYAVAPRHLEFIAEQKANWKTVRVFDAVAE